MKSKKRRLQLANPEKGGVMLEFAIISPVFIGSILMALELMFISYSVLVLEFVAASAARYASVNLTSNDSQELNTNVKNMAGNFGVSLTDTNIKICPATNPDCTLNNVPDAEKFVSIKITKSFNIFGSQAFSIDGLAIARREPFQQ